MSEQVANKKNFVFKIRNWIIDKRIYFLVFLIPMVIMYIAYAMFEVHPFGDKSVLALDLNGQYVYYYEALRDAFWGDGSMVYDWSRNLSGEMFGVFGYYLASPFMLVICLFPRAAMCGAIEAMLLLKMGSAAVTFVFLLRKTGRPKNTSLIIFSTLYALMSYMVVQTLDPMWLDGLIYLPLIIWGVHRLVNEGKMCPYIIPLALMFIAHFYIGYMVGFFTFMYFIYYCFSRRNRIVPKNFFSVLCKFALGTITAILCACIVILPVYNSLKLGKLEFTTPDYSMQTQFDFLTFLTKLFPMSYDTVYPDGLPMIYCGVITLILVPLFFMNSRIHIKEKVSRGILLCALIFCMYIRPIDIAWHGFQVPNWLPYRYSFALSFLLVWMAYRAFENLGGITGKQIGGVFFGIVAFLFWCEREGYEHFQNFTTTVDENGDSHWKLQGIWFSLIAVSVYFLLLYLIKHRPKSRVVAIIVCIVISLELLLNAADTFTKIHKDVAYSKYSSYEPYMSNTRDAVEQLSLFDDEEFYRTEATFHRTVNDPIGTGYIGLSHSSSTMNSPALTLLHQLGYAYGGHYTKYDGTTFMTDALFDIKYVMDKEDEDGSNQFKDSRDFLPEEYNLATEAQEDGALYKFYNNPYALGLGMVSSDKILNAVMSDTNPFENQNLIFNSIIGENYTEYFTKNYPVNSEMVNITTAKLTDGHTKYAKSNPEVADSHVDYVIRMDYTGYLYMYLPTKYERKCNIWIQDEDEYQSDESAMDFAGYFFVGDDYSILNLGNYTEGTELRVRVTISNDDNEAYWLDSLFYTFDFDAFEAGIDTIRQQGILDVTERTDTYVEGTVSASESGEYLLTTIPDEEGWVVTCNGKTVDYGVALGSLITIPLEKGENTITMRFKPNYFTMAIILSIVGLIMLIMIFLFEYDNGRFVKRLFVTQEREVKTYGKLEERLQQNNPPDKIIDDDSSE